jgi:hypothetical protein
VQSSEDSKPQANASSTSAAENIKSFVSGGFGGVCAVLVGV